DDLVGAGHAEMRPLATGGVGDVASKQRNVAAVGGELAGNQIEQRGLAGTVGADDQPALARVDGKAHIGGHAQAPNGLIEGGDRERRHRDASGPAADTGALLPRSACQPLRHSLTEPGTRPSGMKLMMRIKITPSTRFQRSM